MRASGRVTIGWYTGWICCEARVRLSSVVHPRPGAAVGRPVIDPATRLRPSRLARPSAASARVHTSPASSPAVPTAQPTLTRAGKAPVTSSDTAARIRSATLPTTAVAAPMVRIVNSSSPVRPTTSRSLVDAWRARATERSALSPASRPRAWLSWLRWSMSTEMIAKDSRTSRQRRSKAARPIRPVIASVASSSAPAIPRARTRFETAREAIPLNPSTMVTSESRNARSRRSASTSPRIAVPAWMGLAIRRGEDPASARAWSPVTAARMSGSALRRLLSPTVVAPAAAPCSLTTTILSSSILYTQAITGDALWVWRSSTTAPPAAAITESTSLSALIRVMASSIRSRRLPRWEPCGLVPRPSRPT